MVLISCGSSLEPALESPKSNTDYKNIIGKPIEFGYFELAQYDFPEVMNWYAANKACEALGPGWRLPSQAELNSLYLSKDKIGGFADYDYWSSTEVDSFVASKQNFGNGRLLISQGNGNKLAKKDVRAIRSF